MIIDGNTIKPDPGKWLNKGETYTQGEVVLSPLDAPANWREVDNRPPDPGEMSDAELALAVLSGEVE